MPVSSCFYYYNSNSIVEFEVRDGDSTDVPLLYRIALAILGFLFFPYEVEYEELCWDFDGRLH